MITLIGDVHGKTPIYCRVAVKSDRTIQLGDMGLGFKGIGLPPPGTLAPDFTKHKFIRGNHDDPAKCQKHPGYLGEFGYLPDDNLFYIGGAASIDREYRVEGVSWWADEQLSYQQLDEAIQLYLQVKPRFVVSHECPASANHVFMTSLMGAYFVAKGGLMTTRTCQAMQSMLEGHAPEVWVFGHYHRTATFFVPKVKTKFQCLSELDTIRLNTETGELS